MPLKYLILATVFSCVALDATTRPSRVERKLVAIKAEAMSADYRADLPKLESVRARAAELSRDPRFGYLADYWSGFASWRTVVNGVSAKMSADEAKGHLRSAVADFESSIQKNADFADSYVGAAAVHGWLAAYNRSDQAAMNKEVEIFQRDIKHALELEPDNPRALWIQAVPYVVLPPERGGNIDHAIELYRQMLDNSGPPHPNSPLPDWGKPEALMSLANAHLMKTSPDVDAAAVEAREALSLQPDWHYVKDILIPRIEAKQKQLSGKE